MDSGHRAEFESGAVRDAREGKGRCDLLPLPQIAELFHDDRFLMMIDAFEQYKDAELLKWAVVELVDMHYDGNMCTAILDLSVHFENGAKKYAPSNWAKGIPLRCYIDSCIRHYIKFLRGDVDENHLMAALWNVVCGWWTAVNIPNDGSMETIYDVASKRKAPHIRFSDLDRDRSF